MSTDLTAYVVGGGFGFIGIVYAEYVRRSGAVSINKEDSRQKFTDTINKAWEDCKQQKEASDKENRVLSRELDRRNGIWEVIELELSNLHTIHEEWALGIEEAGLKDLALRYNRSVERVKTLTERIRDPDETIGE